MKKFSYALLSNIKQAVFSKLFVASMALCLIFFLLSATLSTMAEPVNFLARPANSIDVLSIFQFCHEVGLCESMLPICCAIPFGLSFYFDWSSKCITLQTVRSGSGIYILSKVIACALSGGLALASGAALFVFILDIRFPLVQVGTGTYNAFQSGYQYLLENPGGQSTLPCFAPLLLNGHPAGYFVATIFLIFLYGAFAAVIGLCVSSAVPNPFVAIFSPFIILFLSHLIFENFPTFLDPMSISKGNYHLSGEPALHMAYAVIYFIVLTAIPGMIFSAIVKRRIRNGIN